MRALVIAALGLLALALPLGACGEDVGPEVSSQEINLYIWREYTPPELISSFEEEFGVTANVSYYENNQNMIDGVEKNPGLIVLGGGHGGGTGATSWARPRSGSSATLRFPCTCSGSQEHAGRRRGSDHPPVRE